MAAGAQEMDSEARTVRAHGLLASNSTIGDVAAQGSALCMPLGLTQSVMRVRQQGATTARNMLGTAQACILPSEATLEPVPWM